MGFLVGLMHLSLILKLLTADVGSDVCLCSIPCHLYHNSGSLFLLLKQFRTPLSTLNSTKHPNRLCSGPFPSF